jgi:hypothetical protein
MGLRVLAVLGLLTYSAHSFAGASFSFEPDLLYTREDYQSTTSIFTMLSKLGYTGVTKFSFGFKKLDVVLAEQSSQYYFAVPSTRTVDDLKPVTTDYSGGLRFNSKYFSASLIDESRESIYLIENSTTDFNLKKARMNFGVLSVKTFGWGEGYRISVDADLGFPLNTTSTDAGDLKYTYFSRGTVHLEFGQRFRFGFNVAAESHEFAVGTARYFRFDFRGGVSFILSTGQDRKTGSASNVPPSGAGLNSNSPGNYPNY